MTRVRLYAKLATETLLCRSGLAALARWRRAGDTLVLAYHNVVPDGLPPDGDRSLHLPQRAFARQLDALRRTHDVVPLETLFETTSPRARRPRAVITFDDAYQGTLTAGIEELASRKLPATIFVAPAFVGGRSFWWDALTAEGAAGPPAPIRSAAFHDLEGRDEAVREFAARSGLRGRVLPEHMTCATEDQLRAAASAGVVYGSHTWSHPFLPALAQADVRRELVTSREWLTRRFANVVNWLAYPYGGVSPEAAEAARDAGFDGALLIEGGWCAGSGGTDPFLTPRLNIPAGLSLNGFELRMAGVR